MKHRVCLWLNFKSHHQDDFIQSLNDSNRIELVVIYYNQVSEHRLELGWESGEYGTNEFHFKDLGFEQIIEKYSDHIHIVGSSGSWFHISILKTLSKNKIPWMTWSEPSFPGTRWFVTYPYKLIHAWYINRYSLGLLAIGTNAQNDYARKGVKRKKMHFLPYAVNGYKPEKCQNAKPTEELKTVLIPGQLCKRKATDVILKAISRLADKYEQLPVFKFIGNGDLDFYQKMADEMGIQNYIKIIGPIESSKMQSCYCEADLVLLFSRFDGWGMVINEAISMGIPVISNVRVGSARHLIKHSINGFLAHAVSAEELAEFLMKYIEQPALLVKHGESALEIFSEFTPAKNADRFADVLGEVT